MSFFDFFDDLIDSDQEHLEDIAGGVDIELNAFLEVQDDMKILFALDRMTNQIENLSFDQAIEYLENFEYGTDEYVGLVSNLKGIYGEIKVLDELNDSHDSTLEYYIPKHTNNPGVDIYGVDESGTIFEKIQVKMSNDVNYIKQSLNELPADVKLVCPHEVAKLIDDERIIDLGISHDELIDDVEEWISLLQDMEPWEEVLNEDSNFSPWLLKQEIKV